MRWLILFFASWVLFIALVDWKQLKTNIWAGLWAITIQLLVDIHAVEHKFYQLTGCFINMFNTCFTFTLGPVFVIGVLAAQYHPVRRWARISNVLVLVALYSLTELLLVMSGNVVYLDWHFKDSLLVNLGAIMTISWFAMSVLNKGNEGCSR